MEGQDNKRRKIEREGTLLHCEQIAGLKEKNSNWILKKYL